MPAKTLCTTERFSTYGTTGFSPVWHLPCVLRQFDQENALVHKEQVNGFSSVWVLRCLFRLTTSENDFLHTVQLKHFSPLSVLACLFRPPARENAFCAQRTCKGFFFCVCFEMISKNCWRGKWLFANGTIVWFLSSVSSCMRLQMSCPRECFSAQRTCKWFFSSVCFVMIYKSCCRGKWLFSYWTFVGFLSGVSSHVYFKIPWILK